MSRRFLTIHFVAAFSAFRVWAIWGKDIRPFLIVLPFSLVTPALNIVSRSCLEGGIVLRVLPVSG